MWYFYVIESKKNNSWYKGSTDDLKRRFTEHNQKRGGSYTKRFAPFELVYYEAYQEKGDATQAEKFYKSGYGREILHGKLKQYLEKRSG